MKVSYIGPLKDYSGYGEANRHTVAALMAAGVEVVGDLVKYTQEQSDFGAIGDLMNRALETKGDYKIRILHVTPDEYSRLIVPGKYHIGQFYWETDRIPPDFVKGLELVDEIWTGSEANKEAMINSGVRKPIYIFPQAVEVNRDWPEPYVIEDFDGFVFYSIFEWIDRKNPMALLRAFYEEFKHDENVALVIKTYHRNFTLQSKRKIRAEVEALKSSMGLKNYPPVYLYLDLMDRRQIMRLHKTGDCFVSAHRGEGWGLPQMEAMLAGNPVISTNYGGLHEWIDGYASLIPYDMVPVRGMGHSDKWYTPDQKWAEVNIEALKFAMRLRYDTRDQPSDYSDYITEKFNFDVVGEAMHKRLVEIEEGIT